MSQSLLNPTLLLGSSVYLPPIKGATGGWTASSGDAPPPVTTQATETEINQYPFAQTVNAANQSGTSGAIVQGGFQLVAGSIANPEMTRQDN